MAISSILKASSVLLSKRRQYFDGNNFYSTPLATNLWANSKYPTFQVKSFAKSTSTLTSPKTIAVPYDLESSNSKENLVEEDALINHILKFLKWLRTPAIVLILSVLLITMHNRQSALAVSGGVMGGDSFSSSSSSSNWDVNWDYNWDDDWDDDWDDHHIYSDGGRELSDNEKVFIAISFAVPFIMAYLVFLRILWNIMRSPIQIIKFQVGLLVNESSLQKDLNEIARTTNTSTSDGWSYMLEETISSLQRHDKYWISGYSFVSWAFNIENAEKSFKRLSEEERKKFSEETLVKLDYMEKECNNCSKKVTQSTNTYMVVTILVAARGMFSEPHIPTIINREDVKKALNELQRIRDIQGLHVLWTPQKRNEILSGKEFQANYPKLKTFQSMPTQASS